MNILTYTNASAEDALLLTEIAINSKKHWGYPDDWMCLWLPELEITADYISDNIVTKVYEKDVLIGFFALVKTAPDTSSLDHMWLIPGKIGAGLGRIIFDKITQQAYTAGYREISITADPNANGFYEKMGAKLKESVPTSIPGRFLNVYILLLG